MRAPRWRPRFGRGIAFDSVGKRADKFVLLPTDLHMALDDSFTNEAQKCQRCGPPTSLLYSFLDPKSGRRVRTYKCKCGEEMVIPVGRPE